MGQPPGLIHPARFLKMSKPGSFWPASVGKAAGESITGQKLKTAILSCMRRAAFSFVDLATRVALSDAGKLSAGRSSGR
jgi:hypothetical protein